MLGTVLDDGSAKNVFQFSKTSLAGSQPLVCVCVRTSFGEKERASYIGRGIIVGLRRKEGYSVNVHVSNFH